MIFLSAFLIFYATKIEKLWKLWNQSILNFFLKILFQKNSQRYDFRLIDSIIFYESQESFKLKSAFLLLKFFSMNTIYIPLHLTRQLIQNVTKFRFNQKNQRSTSLSLFNVLLVSLGENISQRWSIRLSLPPRVVNNRRERAKRRLKLI